MLAAKLTFREVSRLEKARLSSEEAWEMMRGEHLLPPPRPRAVDIFVKACV